MASSTAKVPMIETGTAIAGISVVRSLPRKTNTTRPTSTNASIRVLMTSSTVSLTKIVVSYMMSAERSSGNRVSRLLSVSRTLAATLTALAPGAW